MTTEPATPDPANGEQPVHDGPADDEQPVEGELDAPDYTGQANQDSEAVDTSEADAADDEQQEQGE